MLMFLKDLFMCLVYFPMYLKVTRFFFCTSSLGYFIRWGKGVALHSAALAFGSSEDID
jgi:hypothetical protein